MVNLSLQHGSSEFSVIGYAWMAIQIGPIFHHYSVGEQFGRLGIDVAEKHGFTAQKVGAHFSTQMAVLWTRPIDTALACLDAAIRVAEETGENIYVCYSLEHRLTDLIARGDPLDQVWSESVKALDFVRKIKFRHVIDIISSMQPFIQSLRGQTLEDPALDEDAIERSVQEGGIAVVICYHWILQVQRHFLLGSAEKALEYSAKAEPLLWSVRCHIQWANYCLYHSLALAEVFPTSPQERQAGMRAALTAHLEALRQWSESCPATFLHQYLMVAAETARLDGRGMEALRLYEQAIRSARDGGFVQNEALANELAGRFYLEAGIETAGLTHLANARACHVRWGAGGKVRQLERRYPQLSARQHSLVQETIGSAIRQLDMAAMIKATQAIGAEIELPRLIEVLMTLILQNAGADRGLLFLPRGSSFEIEAEACASDGAIEPRLRHAPLDETECPEALVNYVIHTRKSVIIDDGAQPGPEWEGSAYLRLRSPRSVMCAPLLQQGNVGGVLYLENSQAAYAFTPDRVALLEALAARAAIALENARLYGDLQVREARIRRLVESSIIGIFFWNLSGSILDANDAFLEMLGYSRQELLAGEVNWERMTPLEYRALDERKAAEIRDTRTCTPYEKEFLGKDGGRIPVLIGAVLFDDSPDHGVAFVLDLSERKRAEAEREARHAAEAANRAKSAFLANMSHELRTPLNAILGYAQLLKKEPALSDRLVGGLDTIEQSGRHLLTLITDILDLAKIEAGKFELWPEWLNFPLLLSVVKDIARVRAEQKDLLFTLAAASDLPHSIQADEKRLRQVLLNLVGNAVKFTDRGEVILRVECLAREGATATLRFEVSDSGVGIASEELETIFQPFEQVGAMDRRIAGTGLGLAISRQLVRLMGGEIQVDSAVGRGSRFWFDLTLPAVEAEASARSTLPVVVGYAGRRRTVLIVDDVASNRALLADLLGGLGFNIAEAENGARAIECAQAAHPDLVLMDLGMPVMGGVEAVRRLRALPELAQLPIIMLSASTEREAQDTSEAIGADVFLPKPVEHEALLQQIGTLLGLDWIHADVAAAAAKPPMVLPPRDELEVLHELACLGNMDNIRAWAARLLERDDTYQLFAERLQRLAAAYQSKAILALVKESLLAAAQGRDEVRHP
jgi:PAS domain S-box-containing protein